MASCGPYWLEAPAMGHVCIACIDLNRAMRHMDRGMRGPRRVLKCKFGMGGTASLFLWAVAYDPAVFRMRAAVGAEAPHIRG